MANDQKGSSKLAHVVGALGTEVRESVVSYFSPIRAVARDVAKSVRVAKPSNGERPSHSSKPEQGCKAS